MKLQGIPANQLLLQIETIKPSLKLEPGQILDAKILAKLNQNLFELLVNNQVITAKSEQNFSAGQRLRLMVEKTENPVVLKSFTAPDKVPGKAIERQQLSTSRHDLLRQTVPKQASLQPLAKTLTQVLQKTDGQMPIPAKLAQQLQSLVQSFSSSEKIATKDGLKQAVKESGIFLEAQLLKNGNTGKSQNNLFDIKAGLLKLSTLLKNQIDQIPVQPKQTQATGLTKEAPSQQTRTENPLHKPAPNNIKGETANHGLKQNIIPTPTKPAQHTVSTNRTVVSDLDILPEAKELNRQIEQSLNKIQLNQNNAVVVEKNDTPVWTMDIPVKNGKQIDILNISIYKDGSNSGSDDQGLWSIQLKFNFESLGDIYAKVSLYNQEVMTSLWAEKTQTQQLIEDHLLELETQLEKTGLDIGCIQCLSGKPPDPSPLTTNNSLVDLHL